MPLLDAWPPLSLPTPLHQRPTHAPHHRTSCIPQVSASSHPPSTLLRLLLAAARRCRVVTTSGNELQVHTRACTAPAVAASYFKRSSCAQISEEICELPYHSYFLAGLAGSCQQLFYHFSPSNNDTHGSHNGASGVTGPHPFNLPEEVELRKERKEKLRRQ
eukprot:1137280-Pelagomonas_calceolata.AAC.3